jgi:phosphocarrier protein
VDQKIELIIKNPLGLHARPAASIARIAQSAKGGIWICREKTEVDASSIIDILTLACEQGSRITIYAEDPHDRPLLDSIAQLVEGGFGE